MMLAQSLAFAPAFTAALVAGHRLFQIIDRRSKIQSADGKQKNTLAKQLNTFEGVRFRDIEFRYPTRPEAQILRGLSLEVHKGKTIALVGHSGCGKSTCIQLLQRYYDPDAGFIVSFNIVAIFLNELSELTNVYIKNSTLIMMIYIKI